MQKNFTAYTVKSGQIKLSDVKVHRREPINTVNLGVYSKSSF